ncbi:RND transporter [bacterium]|nr:RND transporter [bacterium]
MSRLLAFFIQNPIWVRASLILLFGFGLVSLSQLNRSFFAPIDPKTITITTLYPGASPEEIERGIVLKIETNLINLEGIDRVTSQSYENQGRITIEIKKEANSTDVLDDVKQAIARIATFPDGMEPPVVVKNKVTDRAIRVVLTGDVPLKTLKKKAKTIENDLRALGTIRLIELSGFPSEEIDVQVTESNLLAHNLTIRAVGQAIRNANIEITGGQIEQRNETFLIRSNTKRYTANELGTIIVKTNPSGSIIRLSDIATVTDAWANTAYAVSYNGTPAVTLAINKTPDEDILAIVKQVRAYVEQFNATNTDIQAYISDDRSIALRQRIALLSKNGLFGFLFILLILGLFLTVSIAFWVALSIPICFMGLFIVGVWIDLTINVISLFGMIVVVGILVDDGIVIAESIYQKIESGMNRLDAAISGTLDVLPSVTAAIITTIIAFMPFFFIDGTISDILNDMAVVVIITLIMSLIEGALLLPAHIAHSTQRAPSGIQLRINRWIDTLRYDYYARVVRVACQYRIRTVLVPIGLLILTLSAVKSGRIPFTFFPFVDTDTISIELALPPGASESRTHYWLDTIEAHAWAVNQTFQNQRSDKAPVILAVTQQLTADHRGQVFIQLLDGETRNMESFRITEALRKAVGTIPEAQTVAFGSRSFFGNPIEISLLGDDSLALDAAKAQLKAQLKANPKLKDVVEADASGLREIHISLKPKAHLLGFTSQTILQHIRDNIFGYEAQRIQRGDDAIKIWVRYTEADRQSIATLERMQIANASGQYPVASLVNFEIRNGVLAINHLNGFREAKVSAALANTQDPLPPILARIQTQVLAPLLAQYPTLTATFGGQKRETDKTAQSAKTVLLVLLSAMFLVIGVGLNSFLQAALVLCLVPFGFIGVAWGHAIHGISINILSTYGIIALTGITVNDAIVFINRFNRCIRDGDPLDTAIMTAATTRFRAIILTSLTTIFGLGPLIFETSRQAQFLIPMAISVAYGLLVVTGIILIVLPPLLLGLNTLRRSIYWIRTGEWVAPEYVEPAYQNAQTYRVLTQGDRL